VARGHKSVGLNAKHLPSSVPSNALHMLSEKKRSINAVHLSSERRTSLACHPERTQRVEGQGTSSFFVFRARYESRNLPPIKENYFFFSDSPRFFFSSCLLVSSSDFPFFFSNCLIISSSDFPRLSNKNFVETANSSFGYLFKNS
jgi:hypothetical protein